MVQIMYQSTIVANINSNIIAANPNVRGAMKVPKMTRNFLSNGWNFIPLAAIATCDRLLCFPQGGGAAYTSTHGRENCLKMSRYAREVCAHQLACQGCRAIGAPSTSVDQIIIALLEAIQPFLETPRAFLATALGHGLHLNLIGNFKQYEFLKCTCLSPANLIPNFPATELRFAIGRTEIS
jgi:hypothetical protein